MKKSTRKVINHLSQYVGKEVFRTQPVHGDWSYAGGSPLLLVGFTSDGCMRCRFTGFEAQIFGEKEFVLPIYFTDRNWITYKKAIRSKSNRLNQWKGKKIKRIRPTATGCKSFMFSKHPTLISASKHHMVIMYNDIVNEGKTSVLRSEYVNIEDWELAE